MLEVSKITAAAANKTAANKRKRATSESKSGTKKKKVKETKKKNIGSIIVVSDHTDKISTHNGKIIILYNNYDYNYFQL